MQLSSVQRWADGYSEEMRHFFILIQHLILMQWARGAGYTAPKPQSSWHYHTATAFALHAPLNSKCKTTIIEVQGTKILKKNKQSENMLSHRIPWSAEIEIKWKTYYPSARGSRSFNSWYFLPFQSLLFSAPLKCDVIAVWRDCFLVLSLIFFSSYYIWSQRGHLDILHRL